MKIQINIDCSGQAFQADPNAAVADLLNELALELDWLNFEKPLKSTPLCDVNGNIVGFMEVTL